MYSVDQGLATAFRRHAQPDLGRLLENIVFMALRRTGSEVTYYRTRKSYEVDFLVMNNTHQMNLIQVCLTLRDPATRQREIRALTTAMNEMKLDSALILTLDEEDEIVTPNGKIRVMPTWMWLVLPDIDSKP